MWACCISISTITNEGSGPRCCYENQLKMCSKSFSCFVCYMHNFFWSLDVFCWIQHICFLVVNFINLWVFCQVIVNIFEIHDIINGAITNQIFYLLDSFGLLEKKFPYVKDERFNLNTLTNALTIVVSCAPFWLSCPFLGSCFGPCHAKGNMICYWC